MADEIEEVDLTQEHQTPTNNDVAEQVASAPAETPATDLPKTPEVEPAQIDEPTEADKKAEQAEEEKDHDMSPKDMAKFVVGSINMALCAGVPRLNLIAEFTPEERDLIEIMKNGGDYEDTEFSRSVQKRFMRYVSKCEEIPFSDDESKQYAKAWEKCFVKWNFKATPETALIVSTVMIVGGRLLPAAGSRISRMFK